MKRSLRNALGLVAAISGLAGQAAFAATYTNTIAQMTAYITNQMAAQNVQGLSIALVDDQTVVWAAGFGQADREAEVAADADTVYHIGSCSKAFLGTAYMQLWDQGRVDLEAPLTNYMAEFSMLPRFTNSGPVTIRSLLNHHSGIPGDFFNGMWTTPLRDDYMDWLINCLQNDYPFAPVNERYYYCNSGFVLLSDAVRRITGTNFSTMTDAMIFSPLGMTASSFLPDKPAISNRLAAAYNAAGERQPPEILNALGSGSMYSSANDMTKYIQMILADGQFNSQSLISSNAITVMVTPQLTNLPLNVMDLPQGLGWDNVSDNRLRYAGTVFWKDGATWFHCAFLGISRDLKLGVAVAQNSPGGLSDTIGAEALRWAILDKQGLPWPTNTFVPTPSPVTNWPQAELDALAGLYVGAAGYHKVVAETGTLTLVANAYSETPTVMSNLAPRANGWFSLTNSQDIQLVFTNLAGHDMLVQHAVDGAFESVSPVGERYVPGALSTAWSSRTNRVYRMVDMHPDDYLWTQPGKKTLRLHVKDGALLTDWILTVSVMEPQTNALAFQRGVHYRKGGAIQVSATNGFEILRHDSFQFLDEAAIPTLAVPSVTNGAIPFANGTQWYWFTGQTGITYRARLATSGQPYFMRVTDREGTALGAGTNGPLIWACASNGAYALAVSATNAFPFTMTLAVNSQTPTDYDGDGRSDLAVYRESTGAWYVRSLAGTQIAWDAAWGGTGLTPIPGDYDHDGKADLAVYDETTGFWYIRTVAGTVLGWAVDWGGGMSAVWGDYNGDGEDDLAVYHESFGLWFIRTMQGTILAWATAWGGSGLLPVSGDYDGDGCYDLAVYAQTTGAWYIRSVAGSLIGWALNWGGTGFVPVSGDYTGDGKADLAVYDETTGLWFIRTITGEVLAWSATWGAPGLIAVPGDYDGDGVTDLAVYDQANGKWYIKTVNDAVLAWGDSWGGATLTPVGGNE